MDEATLRIVIILLVLLAIVIAIAATAAILLLKKKAGSGLKVERKSGKDFLYTGYVFAQKIPPLKKYTQRIRKRIEMLNLADDWTICRKTMRFTLISLGSTFAVLIFLLLCSRSVYFLCISILTVYMLHNQVLRFLIDRMDNKLLRQFESFLGNVRHHYHEHGMVDEAVYDSIAECGYEISQHAGRIYEVLTSSDIDEAIVRYNETAPNKFMKTFIAMCYLVQRFGDKVVDNTSVFLNNLNYLKQEINMELLRREKLGYLFQSLSTISVFPIFTLRLLENWAVSNIPELTEYYNGAYGFIASITLFGLVFAACQLIGRLQSNTQYQPMNNWVLERVVKIPFFRNFIHGMIEKNYARALKYDKLLKRTGAQTGVNVFVTKQVLFAVFAFLMTVAVFINVHAIVRRNLLTTSSNLIMADIDGSINADAERRIIESDRKFILLFRGRDVSFSQIEETLRTTGEYTDARQAGIAAKRILDKLKKYNDQTFKWWQLLAAILAAGVAYQIPWWMLLFRERIQKMNMEDEVMQFHTIILMLIHIERIHVEDILNWMEQFADIFKPSIAKCINNFEYGDRQALEQLAIDEPYTPFVRIVENLQSAADKITIEHAFDELKTEREYYQEKRKQDNEILVNRKGMWGRFIAFIPLGATVFLYLLLPFILVSAAQLKDFSEEIGRVF